MTSARRALSAVAVLAATLIAAAAEDAPRRTQYAHGDIAVPGAWPDEPVRDGFSLAAALGYIEDGAVAWGEKRGCVSCHTNGTYLLTRPELAEAAGKPAGRIRAFFVAELQEFAAEKREDLRKGLKPTQVAYVAAGLAEWDEHVAGSLSSETESALELLFDLQSGDGSFANIDCWPPLESSSFHGATVAAMAAAAAPGWPEKLADEKREPLAGRYDKLKSYLRDTPPPHDYGSVLLLWTAGKVPGLLDGARREAIVEMIWKQQRPDGGWAMRTFAAPEKWGGGNRAAKLRAEPDIGDPASDGHMTGLAVIALREAGVPATDPRIARAVTWIKSNQRESGRWWTRSLNTDSFHFITYSGSCYPLLALAKCGALR